MFQIGLVINWQRWLPYKLGKMTVRKHSINVNINWGYRGEKD